MKEEQIKYADVVLLSLSKYPGAFRGITRFSENGNFNRKDILSVIEILITEGLVEKSNDGYQIKITGLGLKIIENYGSYQKYESEKNRENIDKRELERLKLINARYEKWKNRIWLVSFLWAIVGFLLGILVNYIL